MCSTWGMFITSGILHLQVHANRIEIYSLFRKGLWYIKFIILVITVKADHNGSADTVQYWYAVHQKYTSILRW